MQELISFSLSRTLCGVGFFFPTPKEKKEIIGVII